MREEIDRRRTVVDICLCREIISGATAASQCLIHLSSDKFNVNWTGFTILFQKIKGQVLKLLQNMNTNCFNAH